MEKKKLRKYYLLSLAGIIIASVYPLYMGIRVVADMLTQGTVMKEDYPKYIIPYTPISLAIIVGVLLMPLIFRYAKKADLLFASAASTVVFFVSELLLESKVVVTSTASATLEDWQMYLCINFSLICSPQETQESFRETAAEILIGEYNPAFKLHFYMISLVLILSALNSFYGFAHIIQGKEKERKGILIMQTISSCFFLGLCILACFTAFFRKGEIQVSFISAFLMIVFFLLFGVNAGIYTASFLIKKNRRIIIGISARTASLMTALMYTGEMILLKGRLYRFGKSFLFRGIIGGTDNFPVGTESLGPAPVDLLIIFASGLICVGLLKLIAKRQWNE